MNKSTLGPWPAFSQLDEVGQHAFWNGLGAKEVEHAPHTAIFVRGGVVQEVVSDTADVLIKRREIPWTNGAHPMS